MIYFDQAASSFPKPAEVGEKMIEFINGNGANPGRSGHALAREAAEVINKTREKAAELFGCSDPKKALFYSNATVALNQAIKGLSWTQGDHIIATSFEHNSIRRPLEFLKKNYGVEVSYIPWNEDSDQFIQMVKNEVRKESKLFAVTHASNVTGAMMPIEEISKIAKENNIITLVDASQTAGHESIHMKKQGIDLLAFPGHKGLMGPQGTGMLLIEGEIELMPILHGGTGGFSESPDQPEKLPERLESGTLNTPGIAGLYAAFKAYEKRKAEIVPRETILVKKLLKGLKAIPDVTCYGPGMDQKRMAIAAFNIKNIDSQEIAMVLDSHYNIAVRAGLHCSPLTHHTLQTAEQGIVRVSLGIYNKEEEVETFLDAIKEITAAYKEIE